jgi:hypothetical protein
MANSWLPACRRSARCDLLLLSLDLPMHLRGGPSRESIWKLVIPANAQQLGLDKQRARRKVVCLRSEANIRTTHKQHLKLPFLLELGREMV